MNDQVEVMKKIMELTDTMEEGLAHVRNLLSERDPEKALPVLTDSAHAFANVEAALQPILHELPDNNIQERSDMFRRALKTMVSEYENNEGLRAQELLQFFLEPAFRNWKVELDNTLKPYSLC